MQATLGSIPVTNNFSLTQDVNKIFITIPRLAKFLFDLFFNNGLQPNETNINNDDSNKQNNQDINDKVKPCTASSVSFNALKYSLVLAQNLQAKLWSDSNFICRQLVYIYIYVYIYYIYMCIYIMCICRKHGHKTFKY